MNIELIFNQYELGSRTTGRKIRLTKLSPLVQISCNLFPINITIQGEKGREGAVGWWSYLAARCLRSL